MVRIALIIVVAVAVAAGAAVVLAGWPLATVKAPGDDFGARFPKELASAPAVEMPEPPPQPPPEPPLPSAVTQMSGQDFFAAVTAVARLRSPTSSMQPSAPTRSPPPTQSLGPPQPANAVFSDAQIFSIRDRLKLTRDQEPLWQPVAMSLREIVWNRSRGGKAQLDTGSLLRFQEAATPFLATLNARQRTELQSLASIIGLKLDFSAAR
jgi:hypothetical protein